MSTRVMWSGVSPGTALATRLTILWTSLLERPLLPLSLTLIEAVTGFFSSTKTDSLGVAMWTRASATWLNCLMVRASSPCRARW